MTCKRTIDEEIERIYRSRCREWRLPIQGIVQMFQAGRNAAKQDRDIEDAVLATASLYQRAAWDEEINQDGADLAKPVDYRGEQEMNLSKAERIRKDVSRIEREIKEGDTSSLRGLCKLAHELLDVIENKPATREKQFQDVLKNAIEEARECSV